MDDILIPLKCPVCGAPVDRGAFKCKYCETWYRKSPRDVDDQVSNLQSAVLLPLDCNVVYADGEPYIFEYRGKTFPSLEKINEIETAIREGFMTPNEARKEIGLSFEEATEAINNWARSVL